MLPFNPAAPAAVPLKDDPPGVVAVQIGLEKCRLFWDGRAFIALGVNPFKATEMRKFWTEDIGIEAMAAVIRAGLMWEYRPGRRNFGKEPPSVEDVLDFPVALPTFVRYVLPAFAKSIGLDASNKPSEQGEPEGSDPPKA